MVRPPRLPKEEQREEIVEAATQQLAATSFEQFRLVSLAKSLNMSHSNVYRFFKSKEELFDAVVDRWLEDSRRLITEIVNTESKPLDRLAAVLVAIHESARDKLSQDPSGFALYQHMWSSRSDAANRHLEFILSHGMQLITEAMETGEIVVEDPVKAVILIQAATAKFHTPDLIRASLDEDTSAQLRTVLSALFHRLQNDSEFLSEI